jgi:hypothetical protein
MKPFSLPAIDLSAHHCGQVFVNGSVHATEANGLRMNPISFLVDLMQHERPDVRWAMRQMPRPASRYMQKTAVTLSRVVQSGRWIALSQSWRRGDLGVRRAALSY